MKTYHAGAKIETVVCTLTGMVVHVYVCVHVISLHAIRYKVLHPLAALPGEALLLFLPLMHASLVRVS